MQMLCRAAEAPCDLRRWDELLLHEETIFAPRLTVGPCRSRCPSGFASLSGPAVGMAVPGVARPHEPVGGTTGDFLTDPDLGTALPPRTCTRLA